MKRFVGGGVLLSVVALSAVAETITFAPAEKVPPVVTLVQHEPVYYENVEIAGSENSFNVQKFSNPEPSAVGHTSANNTSITSKHLCSPAAGRLTKSKGVHNGPSGKETWYSLPMGGVVKIMRRAGFSEQEYPYHVCEGCGAKMLGEYVMVAANLELRPKGTIIETSLGIGLVCDTGSFCQKDKTDVDIATAWGE